tara:strand:- start:37 stop:255 length:219 start_codon:yes stop_codon:yes gene_type:complete
MAKRTELEQYAISRKVLRLMREGFPKQQATAIALRMYKDGELPLPPSPKQKQDSRKKRMDDYRKRMLKKRLR